MFVRVKVGIEKKKLSFKHENTRFSRTQTYTVIEENSKKRATEYVIDDLCVCVCVCVIDPYSLASVVSKEGVFYREAILRHTT